MLRSERPTTSNSVATGQSNTINDQPILGGTGLTGLTEIQSDQGPSKSTRPNSIRSNRPTTSVPRSGPPSASKAGATDSATRPTTALAPIGKTQEEVAEDSAVVVAAPTENIVSGSKPASTRSTPASKKKRAPKMAAPRMLETIESSNDNLMDGFDGSGEKQPSPLLAEVPEEIVVSPVQPNAKSRAGSTQPSNAKSEVPSSREGPPTSASKEIASESAKSAKIIAEAAPVESETFPVHDGFEKPRSRVQSDLPVEGSSPSPEVEKTEKVGGKARRRIKTEPPGVMLPYDESATATTGNKVRFEENDKMEDKGAVVELKSNVASPKPGKKVNPPPAALGFVESIKLADDDAKPAEKPVEPDSITSEEPDTKPLNRTEDSPPLLPPLQVEEEVKQSQPTLEDSASKDGALPTKKPTKIKSPPDKTVVKVSKKKLIPLDATKAATTIRNASKPLSTAGAAGRSRTANPAVMNGVKDKPTFKRAKSGPPKVAQAPLPFPIYKPKKDAKVVVAFGRSKTIAPKVVDPIPEVSTAKPKPVKEIVVKKFPYKPPKSSKPPIKEATARKLAEVKSAPPGPRKPVDAPVKAISEGVAKKPAGKAPAIANAKPKSTKEGTVAGGTVDVIKTEVTPPKTGTKTTKAAPSQSTQESKPTTDSKQVPVVNEIAPITTSNEPAAVSKTDPIAQGALAAETNASTLPTVPESQKQSQDSNPSTDPSKVNEAQQSTQQQQQQSQQEPNQKQQQEQQQPQPARASHPTFHPETDSPYSAWHAMGLPSPRPRDPFTMDQQQYQPFRGGRRRYMQQSQPRDLGYPPMRWPRYPYPMFDRYGAPGYDRTWGFSFPGNMPSPRDWDREYADFDRGGRNYSDDYVRDGRGRGGAAGGGGNGGGGNNFDDNVDPDFPIEDAYFDGHGVVEFREPDRGRPPGPPQQFMDERYGGGGGGGNGGYYDEPFDWWSWRRAMPDSQNQEPMDEFEYLPGNDNYPYDRYVVSRRVETYVTPNYRDRDMPPPSSMQYGEKRHRSISRRPPPPNERLPPNDALEDPISADRERTRTAPSKGDQMGDSNGQTATNQISTTTDEATKSQLDDKSKPPTETAPAPKRNRQEKNYLDQYNERHRKISTTTSMKSKGGSQQFIQTTDTTTTSILPNGGGASGSNFHNNSSGVPPTEGTSHNSQPPPVQTRVEFSGIKEEKIPDKEKGGAWKNRYEVYKEVVEGDSKGDFFRKERMLQRIREEALRQRDSWRQPTSIGGRGAKSGGGGGGNGQMLDRNGNGQDRDRLFPSSSKHPRSPAEIRIKLDPMAERARRGFGKSKNGRNNDDEDDDVEEEPPRRKSVLKPPSKTSTTTPARPIGNQNAVNTSSTTPRANPKPRVKKPATNTGTTTTTATGLLPTSFSQFPTFASTFQNPYASLPLPPQPGNMSIDPMSGTFQGAVAPNLIPARVKMTNIPVVTMRPALVIEATGEPPGTYHSMPSQMSDANGNPVMAMASSAFISAGLLGGGGGGVRVGGADLLDPSIFGIGGGKTDKAASGVGAAKKKKLPALPKAGQPGKTGKARVM
ncbi:hypothetical protein HDU76_010642 [Blyttiomyces sp. JEL0837]|nr:hypothetical protein HDU76_010642 [Blyttiomyces sp. JEL0837]